MGSAPSPPPTYIPPPATPPDPFATAQAQQGYNINSAIAQNQLNNTNQVTPYGTINYAQTGGSMVGAEPAQAATGATGGYWNGFAWQPTGATPGCATWVFPRNAVKAFKGELYWAWMSEEACP